MQSKVIVEDLLKSSLNKFQKVKLSMLKEINESQYNNLVNSIIVAKDLYGGLFIENITYVKGILLSLPY
jgi:hypothetical protein